MILGSYGFGFAIVAGTLVVSIAGLLLVRRYVGVARLKAYERVGGYLLSIIGTLYAVLLGFVVVHALSNLQAARLTVEHEANALANIFLAADGLEEPDRSGIQQLCRSYADIVMDEEWKLMEKGQFSKAAFGVTHDLWGSISHLRPSNDSERNLQYSMLGSIADLSANRRTRLISSEHGIADLMWFVLIAGGICVLLFTFFFAMESIRVQIFMTTLIAFTISLSMFAISTFGYPFLGDGAVHPDAFRLDRVIFRDHINRQRVGSKGGTGATIPSARNNRTLP